MKQTICRQGKKNKTLTSVTSEDQYIKSDYVAFRHHEVGHPSFGFTHTDWLDSVDAKKCVFVKYISQPQP